MIVEIEKIKSDIESIIYDEVIIMQEVQATMKLLKTVIQDHSGDVCVDELASALQYSYVSSMVLSVSRQLDRDTRVVSLINVLDNLFRYADYISRDWYVNSISQKNSQMDGFKYVGSYVERERSKTEFHSDDDVPQDIDAWEMRVVNAEEVRSFFDNNGYLILEEIRRDIKRLVEDCSKIQEYRHKFIAHSDRKGNITKCKVDFNDLDKSVLTIKEIAEKYHRLLLQAHIITEPNHLTSDWVRIFIKKSCSNVV